MVLLHQWNIFLCLLTTALATGNTMNGTEKDIIDAIVGRPFVIRTWPLNGSSLFITVKKGNYTRLHTFLNDNDGKHVTVQTGRMVLKYNHTIKQVFLMLEQVSKEDGGLYEMNESFNTAKAVSDEIEADAYERKYGFWRLEINILEPDEIQQLYVGANISMEFGKALNQSFVYNYDQSVAILSGSVCDVLTFSHLHGRMRCTSDTSNTMYRITIDNVTQRDFGLYKVSMGHDESGRNFFNIKDRPTCAVVGDNMTIRWFYNQQGIQRTLRVIHPSQGVMMLVPATNVPQIKSNFQDRLVYSGDVSQSFMLFMLLNLRKSDAGVYTIETVHGNIIPGSKQLIVEDIATSSTTSTAKFDTSLNMVSYYALTNSPNAHQRTVKTDVAIYVAIPVVTAMVGVIMAMIGYLIWLQRKDTLKEGLVLEKLETTSIATPSTIRRPPPIPPTDKEWTCCPAPQSKTLCNDALGLPYPPIPTASTLVDTALYSTYSLSDLEDDKPTTGGTDGLCKDGSEMVDISRDFDPNKTLKDDSKASESAKGKTPSCHGIPGSRNEFVHGANEDDGYESVETVMNMRSAESIRNEDAMVTKDGKPKEQTKIPSNMYNDYAEIDR